MGETGLLLAGILFVLGNAFFVAAEYGILGSRRGRVETMAKRGNRSAKVLLSSLDDVRTYVAGAQLAITMFGIGIGMVTEPVVGKYIERWIGGVVGKGVSVGISLVTVALFLTVVGELVPKYLAISSKERIALVLIQPLRLFVTLLGPLVWVVQKAGSGILRLLGVRVDRVDSAITREDLMLMVRSGSDDGVLAEEHAMVVAKALRFDRLDAADIMVHRLDIKWIDIKTPRHELMRKLGKIPHSRIPVCRGNIDDVIGILYIQDVVKHWGTMEFDIGQTLKPVEMIPENLTLNRIIERMRESKSQILIVMDEYGGTSGLITLEDVVEEVFGDLDDKLEGERPNIDRSSAHRISCRAEVRYDELLTFLNSDPVEGEVPTDTLATILVDKLQRVPKLGDSVELPIGTLIVENMARRRITRVTVHLAEKHDAPIV